MRRSSVTIAVLSVALLLLQVPAIALNLRGTQSLLIEYDGRGMGAMGTLVIDLALTPSWSLTYIHDRSWLPGERAQVHDVSVTRVMSIDRTVTIGWRVKLPEKGKQSATGYVLVAWRWGE